MVTFQTDPTDGPRVSTRDPSGSLKSIILFILGTGMTFAFLGIALNMVSPAINSLLSGLSGGRVSASGGGIPVRRVQ